MTRLRQPERLVLDTLVEAGVARSRSAALAWCVRLVGQHSASWLDELRSSLETGQTSSRNLRTRCTSNPAACSSYDPAGGRAVRVSSRRGSDTVRSCEAEPVGDEGR